MAFRRRLDGFSEDHNASRMRDIVAMPLRALQAQAGSPLARILDENGDGGAWRDTRTRRPWSISRRMSPVDRSVQWVSCGVDGVAMASRYDRPRGPASSHCE